MGDIEELKSLVAQQVREAAAAQVRQENLIAELVRAREAAPAGSVDDPEANAAASVAAAAAAEAARLVARTEKFNKLAYALRKSYKIKYKDAGGEIIKECCQSLIKKLAH